MKNNFSEKEKGNTPNYDKTCVINGWKRTRFQEFKVSMIMRPEIR